MSYRIAAPDEYLAITGMSVKTVKITKAAWVWPFQRCMRFSVQPHDYAMNLQAMTKEKLQFLLPVVFTVGPDVNSRGANAQHPAHGEVAAAAGHADDDDYIPANRREDRGDALMKYAMLLAEALDKKDGSMAHLENIVKGVIEGEVRVLVSSMTMEEIFTEREVFKRRIFKNIQSELSQFGLVIYNANVKELKDAPNSIYFESLSRKAHEGATNQARIDVAEAQLRGNVGEAQRKGEQDREIAKINAETAVQKTERDIERATAEANLDTRQASLTRDVDIARVQAQRALESKDEDLKKEVEVKRAAAEIERLRARDVVKATIEREARQQQADAEAYAVEADARAMFEKNKREAEAQQYSTQHVADANAYAVEADARAKFEKNKRDAEAKQYSTQVSADANAYAIEADARAKFEKNKRDVEAAQYATQISADADAYAVQADTGAKFEKNKRDAEAAQYAKQLAADAGAYAIQADMGVKFEKSKRDAEAAQYATQLAADADAYAVQADAGASFERNKREAEAAQYATQLAADADLAVALKKAEGMTAMADAYAKMSQAFGGPSGLIQYLMIEKGTYVDLAHANAEAVRGMEPKISVWNTGSGGGQGEGGANSATDTMRNVYQMLPPLMTTINEQTGITLPEWQFGKMPATMNAMQEGSRKGINGTNGTH